MEIESLRKKLRLSGNVLDDEISDNISAAQEDMERTGINIMPDNPPELYKKAIELYCKWQFDFRNKGEVYRVNYEKTRDDMSLSPKYTQKQEEI